MWFSQPIDEYLESLDPRIVVDYHNSCENPNTLHSFRCGRFQKKTFRKELKSCFNNPSERWSWTPCDKLRWIPPQTGFVATFVPVHVIKMNQIPSIVKVKFKAGCADLKRIQASKTSVRSKSNMKIVRLLNMELSLQRTESYRQSISKSWRERLLHEEDCWNFHAKKTVYHSQYAVKRSREDKRKL